MTKPYYVHDPMDDWLVEQQTKRDELVASAPVAERVITPEYVTALFADLQP